MGIIIFCLDRSHHTIYQYTEAYSVHLTSHECYKTNTQATRNHPMQCLLTIGTCTSPCTCSRTMYILLVIVTRSICSWCYKWAGILPPSPPPPHTHTPCACITEQVTQNISTMTYQWEVGSPFALKLSERNKLNNISSHLLTVLIQQWFVISI